MSNSNNQTNDIYSISSVEDLSGDTAAHIQGGLFQSPDLRVYRHGDFKDELGSRSKSLNFLSSNADNQITSIRISAGNWRFYSLPDYKGEYIPFGPGNYNLPSNWNDRISSIKRV